MDGQLFHLPSRYLPGTGVDEMTEWQMRNKEAEIEDEGEMVDILRGTKHVTLAMSLGDVPYLVTVSHGYDGERRAVYFHCGQEGKKVDILRENPVVWGQALDDPGYIEGDCDQPYATTQFKGRVTFPQDLEEKRHGLETMIRQLEPNPAPVLEKNISPETLEKVNIGRVDIEYMSGKRYG
jgi:nitroimidazol reductase NimA-like FMN-containing flavoprotein (pyridoxamine 5'-phosphate oxidase superfamily)